MVFLFFVFRSFKTEWLLSTNAAETGMINNSLNIVALLG